MSRFTLQPGRWYAAEWLESHGELGPASPVKAYAVTPRGDRAAGEALCDALRLVSTATSLGGTHSKVSHVAGTTHRQLDDAALAAAGIGQAAVRLSVGLEDPADLLADLWQALDQV